MSFLRKHWQITLPLSLLFLLSIGIGGILLYGHINAPALVVDNITYAMPERSAETPAVNDGGIPYTPAVSVDEAPEVAVFEDIRETEAAEECCPEEELLTETGPSDVKSSGEHTHDQGAIDADNAKKRDTLARFEAEYNTLMAEVGPMVKEAWDHAAEELRPLSIAKRLNRLEELRAELERDSDPNDPEEAELNEEVIQDFIAAMNERGVYFE